MTICRRTNWIRSESESIDEAGAINIKDILGQLNYIGSSGHFCYNVSLSMFLLGLTWLHHACWVSRRPSVYNHFKISQGGTSLSPFFVLSERKVVTKEMLQQLSISFPLLEILLKQKTSRSVFVDFREFSFGRFLSHQLLLFIGRLKLACVMNTNQTCFLLSTLFLHPKHSLMDKKGTPFKYTYREYNIKAITIKICCKIRLESSLPSWTWNLLK